MTPCLAFCVSARGSELMSSCLHSFVVVVVVFNGLTHLPLILTERRASRSLPSKH